MRKANQPVDDEAERAALALFVVMVCVTAGSDDVAFIARTWGDAADFYDRHALALGHICGSYAPLVRFLQSLRDRARELQRLHD